MRVLKSQSNGKVTQTPSMIGKEAEKSQIQRKKVNLRRNVEDGHGNSLKDVGIGTWECKGKEQQRFRRGQARPRRSTNQSYGAG